MSGKIIVIDGLDGSGKTTQSDLLYDKLIGIGSQCRQISFPDYSKPSSSLVKMYLAGEFGKNPEDVNAYAASSFYAVDRYSSYKKYWSEDYLGGKLIIANRYTTSNALHQMSKLPRGEWDSYIEWLFSYEYDLLGLPRHDIVIFLDMPLEVSQRLMTSRYNGNEQRKDIHERALGYLAECRECALYLAQKLGWSVIECAKNGQPRPAEQINNEICDILLKVGLINA